MAMRVALHHVTRYRYDRPVTLVAARGAAAARAALPHADPRAIRSASSRADHFLNWQQDPYGNYLARLVFPKPATRARGRGRSRRRADGRSTRSTSSSRRRPRRYPFAYDAGAGRASWRRTSKRAPAGPRLQRAGQPRATTRAPGGARSTCLVDAEPLRAATRRATSSAWSRACRRPRRRSTRPRLVPRLRRGCWCSVLRHLGLAARFVSGYSIQLVADEKPLEGPAGADRRLHRPARLGRGLSPGRGLGRPRPDSRPARRRRAHPARLHRRPADARRPITGLVRAGTSATRTTRSTRASTSRWR